MRFLRVRVDYFQSIEHAEVGFEPGLNILYGPNDIGKSTLAAAIRAALLTQPTSSDAKRCASWQVDRTPEVQLDFETSDQKIYRVTKQLGGKGNATLERSGNGTDFIVEATSRQVEEKLRKLLGWGIPPPGGTRGRTAIPTAFLAQALLAQQTDVKAILEESFEKDGSEEGRLRLTTALQAFAVDPRFKEILNFVEQKVSASFTAQGRRSTRRDSELARASEQVSDLADQLQAVAERVRRSKLAEERVAELSKRLVTFREARASAEATLASVKSDLSLAKAVQEAEALVREAEGRLGELDEEREKLAAKEQEFVTLGAATSSVETALRAAQAELDAESKKLEAARENLRLKTSDQAATERALKIAELKRQLAELDKEESALTIRGAAADEAARIVARESELAKRMASRAKELEKARASAEAARDGVAALEAEQRDLALLELFGRVRALRMAIEAARKAGDEALRLEQQADDLRSNGEALRVEAQARSLPDLGEARRIAKLEHDRAIAEAALGGGLSLAIKLHRKHAVALIADGKAIRSGELRADADRRIELRVPGVIDVDILAGGADQRRHADELSSKWELEAKPVLERCGVTTGDALVDACGRRDQDLARALTLLDQAKQLVASTADHRARAVPPDGGEVRLSELEARLQSADRGLLESKLRVLGARWEAALEELNRGLAEKSRAALEAESAASEQSREISAELKSIIEQREAAKIEVARSLGSLGKDPGEILAEVSGGLASIRARRGETEQSIASLEGRAGDAARLAQEELEHRSQSADAARARVESTEAKLIAARSAKDTAAGELAGLRERVSKHPYADVQQLVARRRASLLELPKPGTVPDETALRCASSALVEAEKDLTREEQELKKAEGALTEVEGAVVAERERELAEAHRDAVEQQRLVELDADAWKLLRDRLKESESAGIKHVGRVLADRVGPRFQTLSKQRYGLLELSPELGSKGIETVAGPRELDVLSVGTREQLAMLLRLAIAESLGSAIILDDHLVQADPERLDWFVGALVETATKAQVIVVTCRRRDYAAAERANGAPVSWVDLEQKIRRLPASVAAVVAPSQTSLLPPPPRPPPALNGGALHTDLKEAIAEMGMSVQDFARSISAGARVVEQWLEGRSEPAGAFRSRIAEILAAGASDGSARLRVARRLTLPRS